MPRVEDTTPATLRGFLFHGLDLHWPDGKQATGECPFCLNPKFSIEIATGIYRCWSCNTGADKGGGNIYTFMRRLHEACGTGGIEELAEDRELLPETLIEWGVVKSIITGEWLVPGYETDGQIYNLYRYEKVAGKMILKSTAGIHHRLYGIQFWDRDKGQAFICEGPWDGMALYEVMRRTRDGYQQTGNVDASLYADANVVAVPGCGVFMDSWIHLFADKIVTLLYDNDHPRKHPDTGKETPPGALEGMKRTAILLKNSATPPAEIRYLPWGDEKGYNLDLTSGHDVRDWLHA